MIVKSFYPIIVFALAALFVSINVTAEDEEGEEGIEPMSKYVAIEPAFVTNYGGPGHLRYMKVEISLRVTGMEGEDQVKRHMPLVKDAILNLFAIQTNETIDSAVGKESLRQKSLEKVSALLAEEDETSYLEDLLFTEFVVHR